MEKWRNKAIKKISLEQAIDMLWGKKNTSFKTVNQYNYTKNCINIDSEHKTYDFKQSITKYVIADRTFRLLTTMVQNMGYEYKGE